MRTLAKAAIEALFPLGLLLATILLVRHETRVDFASRDTVVYAVAADRWATGEVPYRDFFDHKPPVIYAAYAVFLALGGHTPRAIWQGMTCVAAAASLLVYLGFRSRGRPAAAVATAIALFALLAGDALDLGYTAQNNTESLAVAWGAASFALLLMDRTRWRAWSEGLAGAAFAAAVLSKQPAAFWGLPLTVHLACTRGRGDGRVRAVIAGLGRFGLGFALVVGGCVAYFAWNDAWADFWEWVFRRNVHYARPFGAPLLSVDKIAATWDFLADRLRQSPPVACGLTAFVAALALRRTWLELVTILWLAASLAASSLGLGVHRHYVVFLDLALALSFGVAADWLAGMVPVLRRAPRATLLLAGAISIALYGRTATSLLHSIDADPARARRAAEIRAPYQIAGEIRAAAAAGDRLLGFGDPLDVLFHAGLPLAGPYIYYPSAALGPDPDDYMRELSAARPRFVYVGPDTYRPFRSDEPGVQGRLKRYLDEHYDLWREGGFGRVYRRRENVRSAVDVALGGHAAAVRR